MGLRYFIIVVLLLSGCSTVPKPHADYFLGNSEAQYYSQYPWGYKLPEFCKDWDGYVGEGYPHNYHGHTFRDFGCNPPALPAPERIWRSMRYGKPCWFGRCE